MARLFADENFPLPVVDELRQLGHLELEKEGVKAVDALHAACAEIAECAYLLTCDDGMVSRYNGVMKVLNPVDFVLAIGAKNNDGKRAE
jgi:hypothetical protein